MQAERRTAAEYGDLSVTSSPFRAGGSTAFRRPRDRTVPATFALAVLLAIPVLTGGFASGALPTVPGEPGGPGSGASAALAAAVHSLEAGAGPGAGRAVTCSLEFGQADCGSALVSGVPRSLIGPPSSANGSGWTNLTSTLNVSPPCRSSMGLAYDAQSGAVVLFDGLAGCAPNLPTAAQTDTWTFLNGTWTNRTANLTVTPSPRFMVAMAFDVSDGYLVLFGGLSASGISLNDTWIWSNLSWTHVKTTVAPSQRFQARMVYDAADGYLVLFGGSPTEGAASYLNDTWSYHAGSWTQIAVRNGVAPSPRRAAGIAYDPQMNAVVLFGGVDPNANALGDTWTYHNGTWTNLTSTLLAAPSPRWDFGMTYDAGVNAILLFGGCTSLGCYSMDGDTWAFANGTWTNLTAYLGTSPSPRGAISLAYSSESNLTVFFGGAAYNGRLADTWIYAATNLSGNGTGNGSGNGSGGGSGLPPPTVGGLLANATGWVNLTPALAPAPTCRSSMGMTYDVADSEVLLVDGIAGCSPWVSSTHSDTWTYANGSWTNITAGLAVTPSPRSQFGLSYDANDRTVVLFGGEAPNGTALGDTWQFSGGAWAEVNTSVAPSARFQYSMTYDAADGYVLLFGGVSAPGASTYLNDTWAFAGGNWTSVNVTHGVAPSARRAAGIEYDPAQGYVLLFGGVTPTAVALNDTWSYLNGSWTNLSRPTLAAPSARWDLRMVYDPAQGGVLLFGGCTSLGCFSGDGDTWFFVNGTWINGTNASAPAPSPRGAMGLAYDARDGYALLFAGAAYGGRLSDTWAYLAVPLGPGTSGSGNGSGSGSSGNGTGNSSGNGTGNGSGSPLSPSPPSPGSGTGSPGAGTGGLSPAKSAGPTVSPALAWMPNYWWMGGRIGFVLGLVVGAAVAIAAARARWGPRRGAKRETA